MRQIQVSISLTKEEVKKLDTVAKKERISRSAVVRRAVDNFLKEQRDN